MRTTYATSRIILTLILAIAAAACGDVDATDAPAETATAADTSEWDWLPVWEEGDPYPTLWGYTLLEPTPEGAQPTKSEYHQDALNLSHSEGTIYFNLFAVDDQVYHMQLQNELGEEAVSEEAFWEAVRDRVGDPEIEAGKSWIWESGDFYMEVRLSRGTASTVLTHRAINAAQLAKRDN